MNYGPYNVANSPDEVTKNIEFDLSLIKGKSERLLKSLDSQVQKLGILITVQGVSLAFLLPVFYEMKLKSNNIAQRIDGQYLLLGFILIFFSVCLSLVTLLIREYSDAPSTKTIYEVDTFIQFNQHYVGQTISDMKEVFLSNLKMLKEVCFGVNVSIALLISGYIFMGAAIVSSIFV